jgi:hypothetical protein
MKKESDMTEFENGPLHISVAVERGDQLRGVYAVLASHTALVAALAAVEKSSASHSSQFDAYVPEGPKPNPTVAVPAPVVEPSPASGAAEASPPAKTEVDSAGVAFDEAVHTGTKNKDGTWRRKKGAPVVEAGNGATGTASTGTEPVQAASAPTANAGPADEDDEFAAFTAAAADTGEASEIPARTWTDADLGKLCNQAAVKLGSPDKVRELIAEYVPEGETAHSRNVPADDREAFAVAVESAAGITFAG